MDGHDTEPGAAVGADLTPLSAVLELMDFQITVRYGSRIQRYMTFTVTAPDAAEALALASRKIPSEVVGEVDLVELRVAPDFDKTFPEEDPPGEERPGTAPQGGDPGTTL